MIAIRSLRSRHLGPLAACAALLALGARAQQIKVTDEDELKARRVERNHGYLKKLPSVLTDTTPTGPGIDNRYVWMLCNGTSMCMPWRLVDKPSPHWEQDPNCKWTKVVDRLLVQRSQCTIDNFEIRLSAERCQKWANSGRDKPFSGATLQGGIVDQVLKVFQPGNPDGYGGDWGLYEMMPSCANSLEMVSVTGPKDADPGRSLDTGIGHFAYRELDDYSGKESPLTNVNYLGPFLATGQDSFLATHRDGDQSNELWWTEMYLQAGNVIPVASNLTPGLDQPLVAQYIKDHGGAPTILHPFCYNNRASAFVQGFLNPQDSGKTATAANVNITTGTGAPPNGGNVVAQIINDIRSVALGLATMKSVFKCEATESKWASECGGGRGGWAGMLETYAHSMGAIITRVYGLHTTANIGSVDNFEGASYRNNCDPVPWVTQIGIDYLLSNIPSTDAENYVQCTRPGQMDCKDKGVWRSSPFGRSIGPRTVECDENSPDKAHLCKHWWCEGRPEGPATEISSGRTGMPTQTLVGMIGGGKFPLHSILEWDYCPGEADYQKKMKECLTKYVSGTGTDGSIIDCLKGIGDLVWTGTKFGSDHLLMGNGDDVNYNGYQVIEGLNNLGRPTSAAAYTMLLENNDAPPIPPKPVWCGDGVCDPDHENQQNCPEDCTPPTGTG
ncbi:MAG: hypothetical protein ACXWK8_02780, partial [Myxococcaceae bacterium]